MKTRQMEFLQAATEAKAEETKATPEKAEKKIWTEWYMLYLVYPLTIVGAAVGGYFIYKSYQEKKQ